MSRTSPCFNLPSLAATLSAWTTDITVRFPSDWRLKPRRLFHPRVNSTINTLKEKIIFMLCRRATFESGLMITGKLVGVVPDCLVHGDSLRRVNLRWLWYLRGHHRSWTWHLSTWVDPYYPQILRHRERYLNLKKSEANCELGLLAERLNRVMRRRW